MLRFGGVRRGGLPVRGYRDAETGAPSPHVKALIGRSREEAICIAVRTNKIEGRVAEELRDADGQQGGHGSAVPLRDD
jgi:hypothetical protein